MVRRARRRLVEFERTERAVVVILATVVVVAIVGIVVAGVVLERTEALYGAAVLTSLAGTLAVLVARGRGGSHG